MKNIAIFASGSGTNAEAIIRHFQGSSTHRIVSVYCNKANAGVLERAQRLHVNTRIFNKDELNNEAHFLSLLKTDQVEYIVLAGFLWLVPEYLIRTYSHRIINIHPALLPAFGGKGFYGERVHQAVVDAKLPMSGITIHEVNEKFDEGKILFQAACYCSPSDTATSLAQKIHALEHAYFPVVLEKIL